jgi:hypothetical protein
MKTKFITAIYSDLYGTEFGGRQSRRGHYRYSLLSLLKMSDADFICYTSDREINDLKQFFYVEEQVDPQKIKIEVFDLSNTEKTEIIRKYKDFESVKTSDRCVDIQYAKFEWLKMNIDENYEYVYWIDAGLSHCGLIPDKYLVSEGFRDIFRKYFESTIFNNKLLNNLLNFTDDKIFLIGKENDRNYWSGTVNPVHFVNYNRSYHIIGGLFGGKKEKVKDFIDLFDENLIMVTEHDKRLYHEEDIITLIWRNNENLFNVKYFDTWWHENERVPGLDILDHVSKNKSFYKILEEFNL